MCIRDRCERIRLATERQRNSHGGASCWPAHDLEMAGVAIQMREPLARVPNTRTGALRARRETDTVVLQLERHCILMNPNANLEAATRLHAVSYTHLRAHE